MMSSLFANVRASLKYASEKQSHYLAAWSRISTSPLSRPAARIFPSGENATDPTIPPPLDHRRFSDQSDGSHRPTAPFRSARGCPRPTATRLPSGENATAHTVSGCFTLFLSSPAVSHTLNSPTPPVTSVFPSGL
jgi:hypothetical protein